MSVRPAELADCAEILRIERESPEAPHWPEHEYQKALSGVDDGYVARKVFVWEEGDSLLGFAVAVVVDTTGELESVAVTQAARRRGIGRALCQSVLGWCRLLGANVVRLEVRASSREVITLYEGLGFERKDLRKTYYRAPADDAVLMELRPSIIKTYGS